MAPRGLFDFGLQCPFSPFLCGTFSSSLLGLWRFVGFCAPFPLGRCFCPFLVQWVLSRPLFRLCIRTPFFAFLWAAFGLPHLSFLLRLTRISVALGCGQENFVHSFLRCILTLRTTIICVFPLSPTRGLVVAGFRWGLLLPVLSCCTAHLCWRMSSVRFPALPPFFSSSPSP